MNCKCSKRKGYNVVGIGDVSDFNQDDSANSWVQITVPEVLPLPDCYPDIEDIERIYVNVVIEDSSVIKTSKYIENGELAENEEGAILTGNKLVVDGNICQTIIYTADNCEQSLHSINFKYPFCTSIILPETTDKYDPSKKNFCVEVLVEDLYAKALNKRTICKCVTMFLLAKEEEIKC